MSREERDKVRGRGNEVRGRGGDKVKRKESAASRLALSLCRLAAPSPPRLVSATPGRSRGAPLASMMLVAMDLAAQRSLDATTTPTPKRRAPVPAPQPPPRPPVKEGPRRHPEVRKHAGASPGINIAPGSDDDGWNVPPPVTLSDG